MECQIRFCPNCKHWKDGDKTSDGWRCSKCHYIIRDSPSLFNEKNLKNFKNKLSKTSK